MTQQKRNAHRHYGAGEKKPVKQPQDLRHAEMAHRQMAERGSKALLAALCRAALKQDILLRGMSPEQMRAAAQADWGWAADFPWTGDQV